MAALQKGVPPCCRLYQLGAHLPCCCFAAAVGACHLPGLPKGPSRVRLVCLDGRLQQPLHQFASEPSWNTQAFRASKEDFNRLCICWLSQSIGLNRSLLSCTIQSQLHYKDKSVVEFADPIIGITDMTTLSPGLCGYTTAWQHAPSKPMMVSQFALHRLCLRPW